MTKPSRSRVVHDTIVTERRLAAPPARVFQAFADPAERAKWDVPGEGWKLAQHEQDFRVDGIELQRFGPEGGPVLRSVGRYLDIVAGERIVSAGVMHKDDVPMTATLFTALFAPDGAGTRLQFIDQSVFFGDESPENRRAGWGEILDKLEAWLSAQTLKSGRPS